MNLADVEGLADKLSLPARMAHLLKRGPMTYASIAEELNAKLDTVIKAANRSPKTFAKVSGTDNVTRIATTCLRTDTPFFRRVSCPDCPASVQKQGNPTDGISHCCA